MLKTLAKLYETDFVAWTEETTKLIKEKKEPSQKVRGDSLKLRGQI